MKILRNIITASLFALSITAFADDYAYLNISQSEGESSFQVSQISRITFDSGNMILHMTDGGQRQLPLDGLQKMFFSEMGNQGVGTVAFDADKISIGNGQLRLQLSDGETATIYNMKGQQIFTTNHSMAVQMDNLARGVYIVRVGNAVKKFMKK